MYVQDPMNIETTSMQTIDLALQDVLFRPDELPVVRRMIHATGDLEYRHIISFQGDFVSRAKEALSRGIEIYTDTKMGSVGINARALAAKGCVLLTLIDDPAVAREASAREVTRSICAIEEAVRRGVRAFVIGNAPTALFRLLELTAEHSVDPLFVVGVPVGFVGAAESKEALRRTGIPAVSTVGTKGGSNVAASVMNALLYEIGGRK